MPGWPAAVTETESPSQLIPSEIQRMLTSSTPAGASSTAMAVPSDRCRCQLLELQRVDEELLALRQLEIRAPTRRTEQRERGQLALRPARPAHTGGGDEVHDQFGALDPRSLRNQAEGELERLGHHLAQVADLDL